MARTKSRKLQRHPRVTLGRDLLGIDQQYLALAVVRGYTRADTPLSRLEDAAREWFPLPRWVVWIVARHPRLRHVHRVLLSWPDREHARSAEPHLYTSLGEALARLERLGAHGREDAGVAFMIDDPDRNPRRDPRRGIFFLTPPATGLAGYMLEQGLPQDEVDRIMARTASEADAR
jgi:hypothetical protein